MLGHTALHRRVAKQKKGRACCDEDTHTFPDYTPYAFENTHTALRLAEAALEKGWTVNLFASGDGVHNFARGQKPKGIPNPEEGFRRLMDKGLRVELCGTCLTFRGFHEEQALEGAEPSSMERLFKMIKNSHVFISLT